RHLLAQLEVRDRLARAADIRALAGDHGQLLGGGLEHRGVLLGVAHAHVERDLLDPGHLHRRGVPEPAHELGADLGLVALLEARDDLGFGQGHGLFEPLSAPAPDADLAPGVVARSADPRRITGLRVQRHDVGGVDRPLLLDDAADLAATLDVPDRARLLVALLDVEPLDEDLVALRLDAQHAAGLPLVLAGDDLDHVVLPHARGHYRTSGARETIFMK